MAGSIAMKFLRGCPGHGQARLSPEPARSAKVREKRAGNLNFVGGPIIEVVVFVYLMAVNGC